MATASQKAPLRYPVRYRLEAWAARLLFALLRLLPTRGASDFGGWLGRCVGPRTSAHKIAGQNMAAALPEADAAQREAWLLEAWDNFGRTMVEYAILGRLDRAHENRVEVEGFEHLAAVPADRPVILFCAHLANWEVIPLALSGLTKPLTIVYRAANNPLVDGLIAEARAPYTAAMLAKGVMGARQIVRALKDAAHVIMVVDQKLNTGLDVPFFGRPAFTSPAVVSLAMRYGCPVFPVRTERLPEGRYKVSVEAPFTFAPGDDLAVRAALTQVNRRLEHWIRRNPGQWLWMHRRWPN
jgi:KDO2-lipid IV(A) lauroyltransferase